MLCITYWSMIVQCLFNYVWKVPAFIRDDRAGRIDTSTSETMVLSQQRVDCALQVRNGSSRIQGFCSQVNNGMEQWIRRLINGLGQCLQYCGHWVWLLWWRERLSRMQKPCVYHSVNVPTFTYGHELWVMIESTRLQIQVPQMSFLHGVARLGLRNEVKVSGIQKRSQSGPLGRWGRGRPRMANALMSQHSPGNWDTYWTGHFFADTLVPNLDKQNLDLSQVLTTFKNDINCLQT